MRHLAFLPFIAYGFGAAVLHPSPLTFAAFAVVILAALIDGEIALSRERKRLAATRITPTPSPQESNL